MVHEQNVNEQRKTFAQVELDRKAAVITCILVICRYMIQATRKQMQKTRRTSTTVPLSGKRGEMKMARLVERQKHMSV